MNIRMRKSKQTLTKNREIFNNCNQFLVKNTNKLRIKLNIILNQNIVTKKPFKKPGIKIIFIDRKTKKQMKYLQFKVNYYNYLENVEKATK